MATLEEQIRVVDKVVKECDSSRRTLDQLSRRLDDLYDEVKHYRDFLIYERNRREHSTYKATNPNADKTPAQTNENIFTTLGQLTGQLSSDWLEKLRQINLSSQPAALPGASSSGNVSTGRASTTSN